DSPAKADSLSDASASSPAGSSASTTQPAAPADGSSASSAAAGGSPRTHRVEAGETLSAISTAAYGSPAYYPAIIRANPGLDPQRLKIGMTINLPEASAVKGGGEAGAQSAAAHIGPAVAQTL